MSSTKMMRVHYLIHAEFETPGIIDTWIKTHGHTSSQSHSYRGDKLPPVDQFDFLIVMGGPQSATQLDQYMYLLQEVDLIKQAVEANKPVLGFCLGAQLIAESLSAKTQKSPHKEIGIFPIELLSDASHDPIFSKFPKTFNVMHWHSDMPGIPKGGRLLAKSQGCPRQAFSVGDRIYGLQCHLEFTQNNINDMLKFCEDDLTNDLYVATKEQLKSYDFTDMHEKLFILLDYLATKYGQKTPILGMVNS